MRMQTHWIGLSAMVALLGAGTAEAQPATRDSAAAEALFNEGLALMAKDDWDHACPKFEKSYAFDPSVGPLLNMARCSEKSGKIATAWGRYAEAGKLNTATAVGTRRDSSAAFIEKQMKAIEPRLPKMVIVLAKVPEGLELYRDGQPLSTGAIGESLPVDPGDHLLVAKAKGFVAFEKRFQAQEKSTVTINVELLPGPPEPVGAVVNPPPFVPPPGWSQTPPPSSGLHPRAVAGAVMMGAGGVIVLVGGITGVVAILQKSSIADTCNTDTLKCKNQDQADAANATSKKGAVVATASTVSLIGGAAIAGTGLILLLTAPKGGQTTEKAKVTVGFTPWIGPTMGGAIGGTW